MTRRHLPLWHLLRTKDSEVAPSPGQPNEVKYFIPCRLQAPSWEDLLGQR